MLELEKMKREFVSSWLPLVHPASAGCKKYGDGSLSIGFRGDKVLIEEKREQKMDGGAD